MRLAIALLLLVESVSWRDASCYLVKGNVEGNESVVAHRRDENSIMEIREGRNRFSRVQRDTEGSNSTESSISVAYEGAINRTVEDYYAQRKAVMERYYARQRKIIDKLTTTIANRSDKNDSIVVSTERSNGRYWKVRENYTYSDLQTESYERAMNRTVEDYYAQRKAVMEAYYARQREIVAKFASKTTTQSPSRVATIERTTQRPLAAEDATTTEITTVTSKNVNSAYENNSIDRSNGEIWKVRENPTDSDIQAESSNAVTNRADAKGMPGYYRLGEFRGSKDEKIVYQHNLAVGLKGLSQLEANFEVILEGAFNITAIEAFPYANTRAHFSWISGGPGRNFVKLKLKGYENEGFSYTVKVWAVPA